MARLEMQDLAALRGERVVFTGLSEVLAAGELLVLRGPNGSGKSTLLRMLAGLLRPVAGRVLWDGAPVEDDEGAHRARLAYVAHANALKPVLSVRENLDPWRRAPPAALDAALERLALAELADVPTRALSAGQARRANLARLLVRPAVLWLLDEPTTALDAASAATVQALVAEHAAAGGMVVLSTHDAVAPRGARRLDVDRFAPPPIDVDSALGGWA